MLSSLDIKAAMKTGEIEITPFDESRLGPCSYDLSLGLDLRVVEQIFEPLDLCNFSEPYTWSYDLREEKGTITLEPGECMLATTKEVIGLGSGYSAQIHSKSSLGRLFQTVTAGGAGFCDAGFRGEVTLEIVNMMPRPVVYHRGMLIAQVTFSKLLTPVTEDYTVKGQYSGQCGPTEAKKIKRG